jgi:DNA-binding transcriptional regulator GbsR (MarR family)
MNKESYLLTFTKIWSDWASAWGVNKTMARIQGYLLAADHQVDADELIENLEISRGNLSLNIKVLVKYGLVFRHKVEGGRKEFFEAERDVQLMFRKVIVFRRNKELKPMLKKVNQMLQSPEQLNPKAIDFLSKIQEFSRITDMGLDYLLQMDINQMMQLLPNANSEDEESN